MRLLTTVAMMGAGALVVAGCGNDVPPNAVATVGDTTITKEDFDRWFDTAAAGASQGGTPVEYDAPDFKQCVADKKKQQPAPEGGEAPKADDLKKTCEDEYEQLKAQVMQFLLQAEWVQQEAEAENIKVSDSEVRKNFEEQKKQAFPTEKAYKKFLKTSGMTEEDILFRVKLDGLQQKLTAKVTDKKIEITDDEIEDFYNKNKERFAQPERRDLRIVLTKTKSEAEKAKAALESGQAWKQVVSQYSIDEASKAQGGKLPAISKGQQEEALDSAVFGADKGEIAGPVKTQFGWYVFEVEKITPKSQLSLDDARESIRGSMTAERQQKRLDDFIKEFREKYKEKTECAEEYETAECKGGPDDTTAGAVSGGTPQGQQTQPEQ